MPTKQQLESALINADAAGDVQAATQLANAIKNREYEDNQQSNADNAVIDETDTQPVDFNLGAMVSNVPASAAKTVKDIYSAFRHPLDTALAINNVGSGVIAKLIPGEQDSEKYADAVGQFIVDRYGSSDAFKRTVMEDPVGALSDFAGVLSAGSLAVPKYGSKLSKIAATIDPVNLAVAGGTKAVMNIPKVKNIPTALYKSSAKFANKFDADAVTKTALREGILPTDAGIAKGGDLIKGIDQQITDLIQDSVDSGNKIPRSKLYRHVKEVRRELGGVNLDAPDNLKKINKVIGDFEQYIKGKGKGNLTAAEVQKFKQNIYKSINWKAKQGTGSMAKATTRKAIAKAAKEELEAIIPEIKGLNIRQGDIIELMDAIDLPADRIARRDLIGLGLPTKVIAGSVVGGAPGGAIGFLSAIVDSPTAKAHLAIGLNKIKNQKISNARKRVLAIELIRNAGKASQEDSLTDEQLPALP